MLLIILSVVSAPLPQTSIRIADAAVRLHFARTLAGYRRALGLGQKELAAKARLHTSTISKYECATVTPRLEVLRRLSDVLGVSIDALAGTKTRAPHSPEMELRLHRLVEVFEEIPESGRALILRAFDEVEAEVRRVREAARKEGSARGGSRGGPRTG